MPNTYNPSGTSITDYSSIKFIPGDIIKAVGAAFVAVRINKALEH